MRTLRPLAFLMLAAAAAACSSRPAPTPESTARVQPAPPSRSAAYTAPAPAGNARPAPAPVREPVAAAPAPAPPPAESAAPAPSAADVEMWRPAWWVEGIQTRDGRTVAGAMATEADLLAARRSAVDAAAAALERALGKPPAETDTKVDTLRLPDGRYRAFILVSASPN